MAKQAHWDFSNETLVDTVAGASMTLTRSTPTSCRNSSGQLEFVAIDEPAFHWAYDGTFIGLQCYSGGSVNRTSAADPEDLTNASWFKSNSTVDANAITDPYGTASAADTLTDANDSVTKNCYVRASATCTANDPIECSAFVKVETLGTGNNYFSIDAQSFSGVIGGIVWDLEDPLGAPVLVETDIDRYGVEQFAGGWYRFWMEVGVETDTGGSIYFGMCNSAVATGTYPHDGRKIGLWGLTVRQLSDIGSNVPYQAPVPYSASATIQQDNLSIADIGWYSDSWTNFSYYQEWYHVFDTFMPSADRYSLHIDTSGDATAYVEAQHDKFSATVSVANNPGDDGSIVMTADTITPGANRLAFTVANNDLRGSYNASAVAQDVTCTWPRSDSTTGINFDWYFGGGRQIEGYFRHIVFYDNDHTDAELVEFSTNGLPTAFPGTIAGDGGHIWPPRANDPRWTQMITDSGITATGNFMDDVKAALIALSGASGGSLDDLWKKTKAANNATDTSEPWLY